VSLARISAATGLSDTYAHSVPKGREVRSSRPPIVLAKGPHLPDPGAAAQAVSPLWGDGVSASDHPLLTDRAPASAPWEVQHPIGIGSNNRVYPTNRPGVY